MRIITSSAAVVGSECALVAAGSWRLPRISLTAYSLSIGASITNAIELVAREVCERFRIQPRDLVLIEHYDWRGTENASCLGEWAEHFDLVDLRWDSGIEEREDSPARNG